jgi:ubiquinone/menaquinone biosynthesis C-methylase UbiE
MYSQESELIKKIRKQFNRAPYPRIPLEQSPKYDYQSLYLHNLVTAYYVRTKKVIDAQGKIILDVGCGSGYQTLILAEANPKAKIVGIDISEESIKLAHHRLHYHGFENTEFYVSLIEDIPELGLEFDYINCDEVLYLLPNLDLGLQSLKSVLKSDGFIRANFHSSLQRESVYNAQTLLKMMGLMDENPETMEIELACEIIKSLKEGVVLKEKTWNSSLEKNEELVLMNYLFQGDKGYTIPEIFTALKTADLEFVSMVNWHQWELAELFKEPENLPAFLTMSLPKNSVEELLHLFELLHPIHRLIDFWCAHPNQAQSFVPVSEWTERDWQQAQVHLHPQLRTAQLKEDLINCIAGQKPFIISHYIPLPTTDPIAVESTMAACLLPLWEGTQPIMSLVERWLKLRPFDPNTLEPVNPEIAFDEVKQLLSRLEAFLYVLLECYA